MPEYVRVTDQDTGHKLTVFRSEVANGNYRELKENPLNELGDPREPEFNAVKPSASSAAPSADTSKEK